jgi:hypothetical protein
MTIQWRIDPDTFLDSVEKTRVESAARILGIQNATAIDSYSMTPSGPVVSAVFLIDERYLAEIRMQGPKFDFDICDKRMVNNFAVSFGTVQQAAPTPTSAPDNPASPGAANTSPAEPEPPV